MEESGKNLLEFLEQPEAFPHNPDSVEHIQTHISHVFIAPPFVYKIKKPVDFGFLDYSTLEKRKHFCEREVALNRRLCSGIYLGVVPIRKNNSFVLESETGGEVVEYAVKMKKLEEHYFLHSYLEQDTLSREHLQRLSDRLASFYLEQDPSPEVLEYGKISRIQYNTDENFSQTREFVGDTIDRASYEAIQYYTVNYLKRHADLFKRRLEEKRIVDGHGDLHLEHIHLGPDSLCIYDCIEFNERFRCGDQAVDLAYLAMDLDFHGHWQEERYFLDLMAKKLDDPELHRITNFYKCYRAYVKGKVKSLQSREEEVGEAERKKAGETASRYFGLALRYALLGSEPWVLVFMGGVATGKSALAGELSGRLGIDVYASDRIRKSLAGLPLRMRTPASKREELYSKEMSEKTYARLLEEVKNHARNGESVILDATYSLRSSREEVVDYLEANDLNYLFLETRAPETLVKKRLREREEEEEVISDARLEDYASLVERYEEADELDESRLIQISTETTLPVTMEELYKRMVDLQFQLGASDI